MGRPSHSGFVVEREDGMWSLLLNNDGRMEMLWSLGTFEDVEDFLAHMKRDASANLERLKKYKVEP